MRVVAILIILGAASGAGAETRIGASAGLSVSNMKFDALDRELEGSGSDLESRRAVCFGLQVERDLGARFAVNVAPMYLPKGATFMGFGRSGQFWIKASYLEIPAVLKFSSGASAVRPYLLAGPSLGFKLSAETNDDDLGGGGWTDVIDATEPGFTTGLGIGGWTRRQHVFLEARYTHGLGNVLKGAYDTVNHRGFQILAGVVFAGGRP